jgi:hypothetical protein
MIRTILAATVAGTMLLASPVLTSPIQAQQTDSKKAKTPAKKKLTPGQAAARERQKKCGAEWQAAKASGKVQKGMTWPKFWSACNKRLKGS